MNKIIVVICIFTIAFISFSVGYKVGDSRGYKDGYNEGYLYDCKDELANLYEQIRAQKSFVNYTNTNIKRVLRQLDSANNSERYIKFREDSLKASARYSADSLQNFKKARKYNDSLRSALGLSYTNFIQDDGRVNQALCLLDTNLKKLPECQAGWKLK